MITLRHSQLALLLTWPLLAAIGCTKPDIDDAGHEAALRARMKTHLDAVSQRDYQTLRSTLSPKGDMQLILPQSEIIQGVDGFLNYHAEWFEATNWTFETDILSTKVGDRLGMAIVEVRYDEPERDGVPYFNRMAVSYVLEYIDGEWYVIKDHASSIEKSTDQ